MLDRKISDESSTKLILKNVEAQTTSIELKDMNGDTLGKESSFSMSWTRYGSADEEKILDSIYTLQKEMIDTSQFYEYACQFDRNRESKRVTDIFKSALPKYKDLWSKAGIVNIEQGISEDQFPKNKVCIQTKYENDLITSIFISYKGLCGAGFEIDMDKLKKQTDIIKKNKLTYVNNLMDLLDKLESLTDFCNSAGYVEDFIQLLKKWPMIDATITPVIGEQISAVNFRDSFEFIKFKSHISNATAKLLRNKLSPEASSSPLATFTANLALLSPEDSRENTSDTLKMSLKPG